MSLIRRMLLLLALTVVFLPPAARGVVEDKTGVEYPDTITLPCGGQDLTLRATGVGLREKTIMKVDVYTIVSYVTADAIPRGDDVGVALTVLQQPRLLQMDLRRGFSREKLINAFVEVIDKNYEDTSRFAADMETFKGYFTRDAQDKDVIVFSYCPGEGLTTTLNGEVTGVIKNPAFAEALWSVWFGRKCASDGMKRDLLSALKD